MSVQLNTNYFGIAVKNRIACKYYPVLPNRHGTQKHFRHRGCNPLRAASVCKPGGLYIILRFNFDVWKSRQMEFEGFELLAGLDAGKEFLPDDSEHSRAALLDGL